MADLLLSYFGNVRTTTAPPPSLPPFPSPLPSHLPTRLFLFIPFFCLTPGAPWVVDMGKLLVKFSSETSS